ncbi:MAG TPA: GNAT family N-acetyltransferase [Gaiellaceae bacterium]|jgi:RimJ/RimL family protein N-acetyltransferase|nr:GNAT family N-acetyltransferase [Gaiellaceae bacterium]
MPIRLEPFAEKHLGLQLDALIADPDTHRFTRVPVSPPPDFPQIWLGRYEQGRRDGTREAFAICDENGEFLGLTMAPRIGRESRTAELGYVLSPAARGRGIATEALRLTSEWAFGEGMLRLELLISADNAASKRVAARAGYLFEGVMRFTHLKADLRGDTEIWSRLPTDP